MSHYAHHCCCLDTTIPLLYHCYSHATTSDIMVDFVPFIVFTVILFYKCFFCGHCFIAVLYLQNIILQEVLHWPPRILVRNVDTAYINKVYIIKGPIKTIWKTDEHNKSKTDCKQKHVTVGQKIVWYKVVQKQNCTNFAKILSYDSHTGPIIHTRMCDLYMLLHH